ncbi:MAG: RidA family protein [Alphaproteobacteria bacterium]|nr:RidA family protein [Alphaproteobacteria bacterium]
MAAVTRFNPDAVHAPAGAYSHAGKVKAGSEMLYIAGQVGVAKDGTTPPGIEGQTEIVFSNIKAVLEAGGFTVADLVKINLFIVANQIASVGKVREIRARHMGDVKPASTLVYVSALAAPELLLEVEAIAAK